MRVSSIDPLKLLTVYAATRKELALMPELLLVLGREGFAGLQTVFGGRVIRMPSRRLFTRLMLDVRMWLFVQIKMQRGMAYDDVCRLAIDYFRVSRRVLGTALRRVGRCVENLGGEESKETEETEEADEA